jgi:hypothetical protein
MNTLVAVTPTDLVPAQQGLLEWIAQRCTALVAEFSEAEKELDYARAHKWRTSALTANLNKIAKRQTFYEKLKAAVQAGYVIMPALPMNVIAIRTRHGKPIETTGNKWDRFEQNAQALPLGDGDYKNPVPLTDSFTEEEKTSKGETVSKEVYFPVSFEDEFAMPVELCKPTLLERTNTAMALKIFDEIGIVVDDHSFNRRGDPVVCGTVIDPTRRGRRFAFFIAWALPLDDL